jgi:hypothetical protein
MVSNRSIKLIERGPEEVCGEDDGAAEETDGGSETTERELELGGLDDSGGVGEGD